MGMDVFGLDAKNDEGKYFRANVWYWHPLWDCLHNLHPKLCEKVQNPHDNSGDGLNAKDSLALSKLLKKDLDNGVIDKYIKDYYIEISQFPMDDCTYCENTGNRSWPNPDGTTTVKQCNVCNGTLKVASFATHYHMDLDLMKEFQVFLENCGGFKIC
jgi:hypothetical protein